MEALIERVTDNPILLGIVLVLAAIIIYALTKRLVKVALFIMVLLSVYIGYLVMTGQELPQQLQKGQALLKELLNTVKQLLGKQ